MPAHGDIFTGRLTGLFTAGAINTVGIRCACIHMPLSSGIWTCTSK